jgi:hypothetical protein
MRKQIEIESSGEKEYQRYYKISLIAENREEIESLREAADNNHYLDERKGDMLRNAEIEECLEMDFEFALILNDNSDIEIGEWLEKWGRELEGIEIE